MRLSERMKNVLHKAIIQGFGDVPVYLFGSRVDDSLCGGDIDLAVDVTLDQESFRQCKVQCKVALMKMNFDQIEVDIVPYQTKDKLLASEIKAHAVRLF